MNATFILLVTVGIGFLSGLRAFTPLALVSWVANWGWIPLGGSHLAFLGTTTGAVLVSILALGELVGDKLPKTPNRIQAGPLAARVLTGALSAAAICLSAGQTWLLGALFGAIGSIGGAFGGYHARHVLVKGLHVPDLIVALAEDFVTIAGTLLLFACLFSKSV
jgi:uncharacterized membrane protein